jgi:tRNA (guanine-N7-)-methyltransferase
MSDTDPKHHRRIRSYVLREGRLTAGQQRAFDLLWPRFGIDFQSMGLDLEALFGNPNPTLLEIGFGNGESLARMAQADPQRNYLGIEVHGPGVGHLLMKIEELGLTNLRLIRHDAVEVLRQGITDGGLEGVFLFFPDPWHKKRHHKRRILQPEFVRELERVIRPGGFFHAATDWENYAKQMMEVLSSADGFSNSAGDGQFLPRPDYRPLTKFEQRGQRLGHGVWDLIFIRR